jgi:peptidoglycan/LPS O-acetylase OafA/YrhL
LFVVFHHLRAGFAPDYNSNPGQDRYFFHLPFLRLIITGGNFCVALFFLLSGFVCSIKALRKARQGEAGEARHVAAESILRRIIRLVLPAAVATTLSFICSQMSWYNSAWENGSPWMQRVKQPVHGFRPSLNSLFWNCVFPLEGTKPDIRYIHGRLDKTNMMAINGP